MADITEQGFQQDDLAEAHGEIITDLNHSLWHMFSATATTYPERIAVISIWQPESHVKNLCQRDEGTQTASDAAAQPSACLRWTFEELNFAAEKIAGWLQGQGCVQGENIVSILILPFS